MSLNTKFLLDEIDKLFAKQDAKWDQWFAARDAKWDQRFSSCKGTLPIQISTEPPAPAPTTATSPPTTFPAAAASFVVPPEGAGVGRDVPPRVVPTAVGMAEILDNEPTDEIRNGFVDIAPTDEIRSDGYLTPAVVAPTESVASINPEFGPMPGVHIPRCSALHGFEYDIHGAAFLAKLRRGTCSIALSDTPDATVSYALCSLQGYDSTLISSTALCGSFMGTNKHDTMVSVDILATDDCSMQVLRYITNYDSACLISVVAPCCFTPIHYIHLEFEALSGPIAEMLLQLLTSLIDTAPLSPPVESEISDDKIKFRPAPWPSFREFSLDVHLFILLSRVVGCSISTPIVQRLFEISVQITGNIGFSYMNFLYQCVGVQMFLLQ